MQIELEFNGINQLSTNKAIRYTCRNGIAMSYKSAEAKLFDLEMSRQLRKYHTEKFNFLKKYDEKLHYLNMDLRFYLPLFTKKKVISKRSKDTSNLVKYTEDSIMGFLGIDDSQIIDSTNTRIHSEEFKTICKIQMCELQLIM